MKLPALCLALVAVAACGPKSSQPSVTPPDDKLAWADMDHEQREHYMEDVVLPTMKEKFVAFNAEEFGTMSCTTCHRDEHDHEMPNPKLPKLDFAKSPADYTDEEKAYGEFMSSVVVPEMAKLLGTTPYDPATQVGFGCTGCHTTVDAK